MNWGLTWIPPSPLMHCYQPPSDWRWLREFAQVNGFNGCQLTEKGSLSSASFLPSLPGRGLSLCLWPSQSQSDLADLRKRVGGVRLMPDQ